MNSTYILSGYGFDDGGPYFVLDGLDRRSDRRQSWHLLQKDLTLSWSADRYCIGRFDLRTYESDPCPNGARVFEKRNRCRDCEYACGFNPAFYNVPEHQISPQQAVYNARPHAVYLAFFDRRLLKVGIASEDRNVTRLLEQGALAAKIIAICENAYEARRIEKQISDTKLLREMVHTVTKRSALVTGLRAGGVGEELDAAISNLSISLGMSLETRKPVDLLRSYFGGSAPTLEEATDLTGKEIEYVSGNCIGLVGDSLILRQGERNFVFGLKTVLSQVVQLDNRVRPNAVQPEPTQLRLL